MTHKHRLQMIFIYFGTHDLEKQKSTKMLQQIFAIIKIQSVLQLLFLFMMNNIKQMLKNTLEILLFSLLICFAASQCSQRCLKCNFDICAVCKDQYESDLQGNCHEKSIENCQIYDSNIEKQCMFCKPTFTLQNNTCVKSYTGCIHEDSIGSCVQCGFGRRLWNFACQGVINCQTFSQNCEKCLAGYELKDNVCVDISEGCEKVRSNDGVCQFCKEGYFQSGYKCFENKYKSQICHIHATDSACQYCKYGYFLINGQCLVQSPAVAVNPTNTTTISLAAEQTLQTIQTEMKQRQVQKKVEQKISDSKQIQKQNIRVDEGVKNSTEGGATIIDKKNV